MIRQILKGYEEGRVTREEMETAAGHLLCMIRRIHGKEKYGRKIYKTVENSGVMNVVAGALAIAVGVSALVSGIRLLITRRKLLF